MNKSQITKLFDVHLDKSKPFYLTRLTMYYFLF